MDTLSVRVGEVVMIASGAMKVQAAVNYEVFSGTFSNCTEKVNKAIRNVQY